MTYFGDDWSDAGGEQHATQTEISWDGYFDSGSIVNGVSNPGADDP